MQIFTYWSNKTKWHDTCLCVILAKNIADADKQFEKQTSLKPSKTGWVGCTIKTHLV